MDRLATTCEIFTCVCLLIVFQHNMNTALFLLPHIMLYVAIDGSPEDHKEVRLRIGLASVHFCCGRLYERGQ